MLRGPVTLLTIKKQKLRTHQPDQDLLDFHWDLPQCRASNKFLLKMRIILIYYIYTFPGIDCLTHVLFSGPLIDS